MNEKPKRHFVLQKDIVDAKQPPVCSTVAQLGEQLAADWLTRNGYKIIDRNWHSGRFGEIDLIAFDPANLLVMIEVKTRKIEKIPRDFEMPPDSVATQYSEETLQGFAAIDWRKRRKLLIAAQSYMARRGFVEGSCRLDALVVTYRAAYIKNGQQRFQGTQVLHVPGAFSEI